MTVFNVDNFIKNSEGDNATIGDVLYSENDGKRTELMMELQNCGIEPLVRNAIIAAEEWKNFLNKRFGYFKDILETYRSNRPKYEANAKKWGTFGWSIFQQMPLCYLCYTPKSDIAATRFANQYFKQHPISELISDIKDFDSGKNTFFNEAVWQYRKKRYMACALIMFELIENQIISQQPIQENKKRASGTNGFKNVCKDDLAKQDCLLFLVENLTACFETFFKNAKDFQIKSKVLNRHFLNHGMIDRNVTEKDCRQLMLFYYNLRFYLHKGVK